MSVAVFGSGSADPFSETLVYDELVRGVTDEADLEGPNLEATKAFLSINRLCSYFDLIYCSRSLSRAGSSNLGGGGFRTSFGL